MKKYSTCSRYRLGLLAGALLVGGLPLLEVRGEDCQAGSLNSTYWKILETSARGATARAGWELGELYTCVGSDITGDLRILDRAVKDLGELLSAVCSQGCLLAQAAVHLEASRNLQEVGRSSFSKVNLDAFERALELHRATSKADWATAPAGRLLASKGILLRGGNFMVEAGESFQGALQNLPEDPSLLHCAATLEEKLGNYKAARKHLRKLVVIAPEDGEARLRLALVEARLEKLDEAEESLKVLLEMPGPSWARLMGYQELAKVRKSQGDEAGFFRTLGEAREEFPEDQALLLQEAFALRRDRRASEARSEELARLEADSGSLQPSSRLEYNEWPLEEIEPLFVALAEDLGLAETDLQRGLRLLRLREETRLVRQSEEVQP